MQTLVNKKSQGWLHAWCGGIGAARRQLCFFRTASERSELRAKRAAHEVSEAVLLSQNKNRLQGDHADSHNDLWK